MYVTPKEASERFGVSTTTLTRWADSGIIEYKTTAGGHRRYKIEEENVTDEPIDKKNERRYIIYCRVSSKKQQDDLERQIDTMVRAYPNHELIKDIGSGMSVKRPGFQRILEALLRGDIEEVVVYKQDRLSRFGYDLIEWLFQKYESKLRVHAQDVRSESDKFAEDIMEVLTVFTARYNGRRKYGGEHEYNSDEDQIEC